MAGLPFRSRCPFFQDESVQGIAQALLLSPPAEFHRDVLVICPFAERRSDGWLSKVTVPFEALCVGLLIPVLWLRNRTYALFVGQYAGNLPQVGETWTGCEIDPEGFIYPGYPPGVAPDCAA